MKLREDELLKGLDLILQMHQICDCLVSVCNQHPRFCKLALALTNPSFGSLMDRKLIYSSYSNVPATAMSPRCAGAFDTGHTIESWVIAVK